MRTCSIHKFRLQPCYNNGDAHQSSPPPKANEAAWVRSPEWEGRPAPDDSYGLLLAYINARI